MLDEASRRRVKDLCDLIAKEQDHHRFSELLAELNQVLDESDLKPHTNRKGSEADDATAQKDEPFHGDTHPPGK